MIEGYIKIADSLMQRKMTLKEIVGARCGITYKNFYTALMTLEKMGFLVYEESKSKSGCKCRYGILDVVKGSKAESLIKGVRNDIQ